ncbi:hypothetical protein CK203_078180 [Vitis vinifera]|uniref:Uncharacterized protein n=1 Tax=Vitis vinifera TaxID=29760 RepID=A0A438DUK7_VITVI|nr:hypothetical protein CK203_078180 [Vitis vinifera]
MVVQPDEESVDTPQPVEHNNISQPRRVARTLRHVTRRPVIHRRHLSDLRSGAIFSLAFLTNDAKVFVSFVVFRSVTLIQFRLRIRVLHGVEKPNASLQEVQGRPQERPRSCEFVLSSSTPSTSSGGGPVIELVSTSLLNPNRSYVPLSTEDPGIPGLVLYPLCIDSWKRLEFVLNSWAL